MNDLEMEGVLALYVGSIEVDHGEYYAFGPDANGRYVLRNDDVLLTHVSRESFIVNDEAVSA